MTGEHTTEPFDIATAVDKLDGNDVLDDDDDDVAQMTSDSTPVNISADSRVHIESVVEQVWPAPEFREHQKETVVDVLDKLYIQDNDVVTLSAPTGAGKSLIIYAVGRAISVMEGAKSFVTTPLNSLIDQIENDEFIERVTTIKGKNNYGCVHPRDKGTAVSDAICQREDDFSCEFKSSFDTSGGCPYYGRKVRAMQTDIAVTNLSYLMANSMIPETEDARFQPRNFLAIDECIPEGEVVTTTDGRQVEIERFKCEEPLSLNTESHTMEEDSLITAKQTATKECVSVEASRGSFTASHDHKVKGISGWIEAKNVERIARPIIDTNKKSQRKTRASILGYWFGDGWISSSVGVSGDITDLKELDKDVNGIYGFSVSSKRQETGGGSVNPTNGSRHSIDGVSNTYNYSRELGDVLVEDGLPEGDKTTQNCHIPHFDTKEEKKAFIAGFFGAEGHSPSVVDDGMCFNVIKASRYTTGDCPFINEMKEMLQEYGISCYVDISAGNTRKDGTETTCYELVIESTKENILKFTQEIGFEYCKRKQVESQLVRIYLSEYLTELNTWRSDYEDIITSCENRGWEYGAVKDEVTSRGYAGKMKRYVSKREKPKQITEFPSFNEWKERYVNGDIVYEQVNNIKEIGEKDCYDLEVKNNHNFLVGDGYVAHNCQNIEDFALNFIGFTIDRREIPINFKAIDNMPDNGCDMAVMVSWLKTVLTAIIDRLMRLNEKPRLTETENKDQDDLEQLKHRISNFIQDYDEGRHWTKTRDGSTIKFEPVFIGRFIDRFLWSQSEKILLSSATIPKGDFLDAVGLSGKSVAHVTVPSTFPEKRRPVITQEAVGKMTKSKRDKTIPDLADKLEEIANFHSGEKGFVHCHSYSIMQRLYDNLPHYLQERTMLQDPNARTESLEKWFASPHQLFLSVSMDEGISLDDEKARWQVVAKASYPFLGDERVNYRVKEMGDWQWYAGCAVIDLQQAVGRGMRSKDDWCVTYLLDSSLKKLLRKNKNLFEPWFRNSVDCDTDLDVFRNPDDGFSFSS